MKQIPQIPKFKNPHKIYFCNGHHIFFRFHTEEGIPYCPECKKNLLAYKEKLEKQMREEKEEELIVQKKEEYLEKLREESLND